MVFEKVLYLICRYGWLIPKEEYSEEILLFLRDTLSKSRYFSHNELPITIEINMERENNEYIALVPRKYAQAFAGAFHTITSKPSKERSFYALYGEIETLGILGFVLSQFWEDVLSVHDYSMSIDGVIGVLLEELEIEPIEDRISRDTYTGEKIYRVADVKGNEYEIHYELYYCNVLKNNVHGIFKCWEYTVLGCEPKYYYSYDMVQDSLYRYIKAEILQEDLEALKKYAKRKYGAVLRENITEIIRETNIVDEQYRITEDISNCIKEKGLSYILDRYDIYITAKEEPIYGESLENEILDELYGYIKEKSNTWVMLKNILIAPYEYSEQVWDEFIYGGIFNYGVLSEIIDKILLEELEEVAEKIEGTEIESIAWDIAKCIFWELDIVSIYYKRDSIGEHLFVLTFDDEGYPFLSHIILVRK